MWWEQRNFETKNELQKTALGERHHAAAGDDEVVEDTGVHEGQRLAQRLRQQLVGPAGLGVTRRVVVGQDHRRGVAHQGTLDDLARIDAGLGQGAAEQLLCGDHAVLRIEEQGHEDLVLQTGQGHAQVVAHGLGRGQHVALLHLLG